MFKKKKRAVTDVQKGIESYEKGRGKADYKSAALLGAASLLGFHGAAKSAKKKNVNRASLKGAAATALALRAAHSASRVRTRNRAYDHAQSKELAKHGMLEMYYDHYDLDEEGRLGRAVDSYENWKINNTARAFKKKGRKRGKQISPDEAKKRHLAFFERQAARGTRFRISSKKRIEKNRAMVHAAHSGANAMSGISEALNRACYLMESIGTSSGDVIAQWGSSRAATAAARKKMERAKKMAKAASRTVQISTSSAKKNKSLWKKLMGEGHSMPLHSLVNEGRFSDWRKRRAESSKQADRHFRRSGSEMYHAGKERPSYSPYTYAAPVLAPVEAFLAHSYAKQGRKGLSRVAALTAGLHAGMGLLDKGTTDLQRKGYDHAKAKAQAGKRAKRKAAMSEGAKEKVGLKVATKLGAKQAARFVPVAGQAMTVVDTARAANTLRKTRNLKKAGKTFIGL